MLVKNRYPAIPVHERPHKRASMTFLTVVSAILFMWALVAIMLALAPRAASAQDYYGAQRRMGYSPNPFSVDHVPRQWRGQPRGAYRAAPSLSPGRITIERPGGTTTIQGTGGYVPQ